MQKNLRRLYEMENLELITIEKSDPDGKYVSLTFTRAGLYHYQKVLVPIGAQTRYEVGKYYDISVSIKEVTPDDPDL